MLDLFFSQAFFDAVRDMISEIIKISTLFMTFAVIIYFITLVFRMIGDRGNDNMNSQVWFVLFAILGLATYQIWAIWIGKIFVIVSRAIYDLRGGNIISDYLGAFFASGDGSGLRLSLFNLLSLETLSSLSYLLVMVIYEIFVVIQVIVQIFFFLLGPLAIVISLFPTFHDVFKVWLANFCAVNFWSVLAAILFRLVSTLTNSQEFQTALRSGDKGVLWDTFILGVIISVSLILIPKFASGIFRLASASADLGTYGTGITAGVVISTVWSRLKSASTTMTRTVSSGTAASVIGGAQALSGSPAAEAAQELIGSSGGGGQGASSWPFGGSTQPGGDMGGMQ